MTFLSKLLLNPLKIRVLNFFFGKYNIFFYPKEIKKIVRKISLNKNVKNINYYSHKFSCIEKGNTDFLKIYEMQFFKINEIIKYWKFKDNEKNIDIEKINSIHRFNWVLFNFSSNINENLQNLLLFREWKKYFSSKKNSIAWQPYNISERICNWIILIHSIKDIHNTEELNEIIEEIYEHIKYLITHLEYPSSGIINNHVLNNARALYFGGLFFKDKEIINLAKEIMISIQEKIFSKNGILNESSTHYHFLITRSLLEILTLAKSEKDDQEFIENLEEKISYALDGCNFFLNNQKLNINDMPKIGDISPDIPFNWFNPFIKNGWSQIWNFNITDIKYYKKNKAYLDGWLKLEKKNWSAFSYLHPNLNEYPSGHGHDDFASINLYHNYKPILVDIGCMSYDNKSSYFNCGRNSYDHNTLRINGKSLIEPGVGRKSVLSSKLRSKCFFKYSSDSINWNGITNQNISWKRKVEFFSEDRIIVNDECNGNNFKFMNSYYYISNYLKLSSQNKNTIIFKTNNIEDDLFEFIFDKDCEIKVEDAYFFSNYGIKENIKRIKTNIRFPKKILVLEINHIKLQK